MRPPFDANQIASQLAKNPLATPDEWSGPYGNVFPGVLTRPPGPNPAPLQGGGALPRTSLFAHRERDLLREAASNLSDFFLRFHFQGLKSLPRAERRLGGFFSGGGERRGPTPPRPARVPSPAARTIPFVLPPPLFAVKRKSKILPTKFFFLFLINSKFFLLIF